MKRDSYLVGKAFRSFLFASVMTVAASQMGAFIDGLMVTWFISDAAMSAVNISTPVLQLYFSLCLLLGVGGTLVAGNAIGRHDRPKASRIFSLSLLSAVTAGILLGAGGMIFFAPLVGMLCPDSTLIGFASDYLKIIVPSAPVYMLMIVLQLFVALDGEPKRVTAAVCTCIAVNLILDYIFIALFGWGMTGAAVATVISYIPAILILSMHFRKPETLRLTLRTGSSPLSSLSGIIGMSAPSGFTAMLMSVQIFICNIIAIHYLGTSGVIVFAVCMYLLRLSMIILTGAIDSFQPVASILAGSGDNRGVLLVVGKAYSFLTASLVIYAGIMILFPEWIGALFGITDPQTSAVVRSAIPAYAVNIMLQCAVGLMIPVYQVYSNRGIAMLISIGQPLLPILFFFIMAAAGANAWWGFAIGQGVLLLIVAPAALAKKGDHVPFLLIPVSSADKVYDTSFLPTVEDIGAGLLEVDNWMKECGIEDSLRFQVGVSCEEILKNISDHARGINRSKASIDMRVTNAGAAGVTVVIHDGGTPFNPIREDPQTGLGLQIVKGSCGNIRYEYLFSQNILTMSWDNQEIDSGKKKQ